jgi:hypothetical protein
MSWRLIVGIASLCLLGAYLAVCVIPSRSVPASGDPGARRGPVIKPGSRTSGVPARRSGGPRAPASSITLVDAGDSMGIDRLLEASSPGARTMFEEGMRLLQSSRPREARERLQELVNTCPDDAARAPASWVIGLTYYLEGDTGNLHQAANQWLSFRDTYRSRQDLQELVHAAMIDIPVVLMDIMRFGPSEYERIHVAKLALETLQDFLDRWPDDPQAELLRASREEVRRFLSVMNAGR